VRHAPFTRAEIGFLLGVPLAWGVLLLFHPTGDGDEFYPVVKDEITPWLVVHLGTLLFVPLMAVVVYLLLRGIEGTAARVARIALLPFAVVYTAWEVLIGIGTGVLTNEVNALPAAQQATGAELVEDYTGNTLIMVLEQVGAFSWGIAIVAAAIALVRAGAPRAVALLLVLSAVPTVWHVPPFGQAGLALFIAAVILVLRGRSSPAGSEAGAPAPEVVAAA
jgi:hypothetical protein